MVSAAGGVSILLIMCAIFFVLSGAPFIISMLFFSLIETDLSINDSRTEMTSEPTMYFKFIVVTSFSSVTSAALRAVFTEIKLNAKIYINLFIYIICESLHLVHYIPISR